MRILYFSQGYGVHDHRFVHLFADQGHDVFVLCLTEVEASRPCTCPSRITHLSWPVEAPGEACPAHDLLQCMPDLESLVRQVQPDLVYAGPIQSCGFMAALLDLQPLVLMSWGYDILVDMNRSPLDHWLTRFSLARAGCFVCDCDAVRVKAEPWLETDRIVQLPWGIDLDQFTPQGVAALLRDQLGWTDNMVLISNRSWEPLYGIDTLLEGFARAWQQLPSLRLILIGSGSLQETVDRFIGEHHLDEIITCPGRIPHDSLADYYRAADLYVSCSRTDGSSVSLLEALGCGLPAVVTDIGGNPEWIHPDSTGTLFPVDDHAALAETLVRYGSADKDLLKKMGRQGRRLVEQQADWTRNSPRLLAAIEAVAPKKNHTA